MFLSIPLLTIILTVLCTFSIFFSASETALVSVNRIRVRHLERSGRKRARIVHQLITRLDKLITAVLVGNNIVNITISAIATVIFVNIFGPRWGIVISTVCVSFFVLIVCEITPKIFSTQHSEKVSLFVAPLMQSYVKIVDPVIKFFNAISNVIIRIFGGISQKRLPLITEEELRFMIEIGKEEGVVSDEERRLLQRIFVFGDTKAADVMIPRDKIASIDINADLESLLNVFVKGRFSRVPVYDGKLDNIIGIVRADKVLDLLKSKGTYSLRSLIDEVYFILPTKRITELLRDFQQKRIQIAIVVDEAKKVLGLVTLEDLLEEIVGEIEK